MEVSQAFESKRTNFSTGALETLIVLKETKQIKPQFFPVQMHCHRGVFGIANRCLLKIFNQLIMHIFATIAVFSNCLKDAKCCSLICGLWSLSL